MTDPTFEGIDDSPSDDSQAGEPFPWPPASGESVLNAWGRTWSGASLRPERFFAAMPPAASLGPAILYYLTIGILVAGARLFWTMAGVFTDSGAAAVALGASAQWGPLVDFLIAPVMLLFSLFVSAGVTHLMLLAFGAGQGGAATTVRVFAYAYSPQLLGVVPYLGTIAGFVWMVVVAIIGLRTAHRTTTPRVVAAVLIPLAVGLFFVIVGMLLLQAGQLLELPV